MVPLTSEDLPLMLTTSVQGPTSAAPSLLSLLNSNVSTNLISNVQDIPLEERERASPSENKPCSQAGTLLKRSCPGGHPHQKDVPLKKQKAVETGGNQTLQIATGTPSTAFGGGSALALLAPVPPLPRITDPTIDPPRRSTSSKHFYGGVISSFIGSHPTNSLNSYSGATRGIDSHPYHYSI
ncbi:UNVERIFIED_CONTAM: hypothetical protein Slati_3916900 [Sesamum latifolium]|uniref:Uncharacterized protein n=1 Tax=Sesamum latifolium TaxID=2727402 RepID=A0AAW2TM09_9LAMI